MTSVESLHQFVNINSCSRYHFQASGDSNYEKKRNLATEAESSKPAGKGYELRQIFFTLLLFFVYSYICFLVESPMY